MFWILFSFLSSFITCTQIEDNSTSYSDDDYDDAIYADEVALTLLIFFAIFLTAAVLVILSGVYIIAGISRNEKVKDMMLPDL